MKDRKINWRLLLIVIIAPVTVAAAGYTEFLSIAATQAMHGDERTVILLLCYGGGWFVLFGFAALLPMLSNSTARKSAVAAFFAFGAGGGVAGCFFTFLLMTNYLHTGLDIIMLLPWLLGVTFWFLRRAIRARLKLIDE